MQDDATLSRLRMKSREYLSQHVKLLRSNLETCRALLNACENELTLIECVTLHVVNTAIEQDAPTITLHSSDFHSASVVPFPSTTKRGE